MAVGNRVFVAVVFVLWGATMSWLVTAKILPPFFNGEPPAYGTPGDDAPVAWDIELAGLRCGTAVTQAVSGVDGTTEIHSRVLLKDVPVSDIAPRWMLSLVRSLGNITFDMRSRTTLDTLGSLAAVETRIHVNDLPTAVRMTGQVRNGNLDVRLQTGDYERTTRYPWREQGLLGGELTPDPKLLHLYVGKTWRKEVFTPFGASQNPVEMIEAEVVEEERLEISGRHRRTRRIEYRSTPAAGVSGSQALRAVVWVAEDGEVLRQDAYLMSTKLRFTRLSRRRSSDLASQMLELARYATVDAAADD